MVVVEVVIFTTVYMHITMGVVLVVVVVMKAAITCGGGRRRHRCETFNDLQLDSYVSLGRRLVSSSVWEPKGRKDGEVKGKGLMD